MMPPTWHLFPRNWLPLLVKYLAPWRSSNWLHVFSCDSDSVVCWARNPVCGFEEHQSHCSKKVKKRIVRAVLCEKRKKYIVENPGIDPGTSRMLSERSTIWANSPSAVSQSEYGGYICYCHIPADLTFWRRTSRCSTWNTMIPSTSSWRNWTSWFV